MAFAKGMVIKMDFDAILSEILTYGDFIEIEEEDTSFSELKYPKLLPMMRMYPKRYALRDFGQVFTMKTKGPMGMELFTISFCPGEGCEMPFLLIDCMKVGKKRTVFVEYYDCTAESLSASSCAPSGSVIRTCRITMKSRTGTSPSARRILS
ncbi:MAG: hypothetical protein IJP67_01060 [Oscillospiraceae bacterium]|nr:hypothetical protein [Oscillospiraceae bacterium]